MIYIIYFERWKVREWFQKYKYKKLDFYCLLLGLENMKEVCREHLKHSDACSHRTSFSLTPQSSDKPGHLIPPTSSHHLHHSLAKCSNVITAPNQPDPFMLSAVCGSLNYATTPVECSDVWISYTVRLLKLTMRACVLPKPCVHVCLCVRVWAHPCACLCACSFI